MHSVSRTGRRAALTSVIATGIVLLSATAASAHVEATAEGAQAGAGPVLVAFTIEAESSTAGITGVKTQLPVGLAPSSVSLASGPDGWVLTPTSDGYEVGGPAMDTGVNAQFAVTITQLPADTAAEVPFKTLVRYSDGSEDAWIELPTSGNPEPENPAPAITVAPAVAPAAPTTAASATPGSSPTTEPSTSTDTEPAASTDDGSSSTGLIVGAVIVVAALTGAALWFRRKQSSGS